MAVRFSLLLLFIFIGENSFAFHNEELNFSLKKNSSSFIENKGQELTTDSKSADFILFKAEIPGLNLYVTETGFSYVFLKPEENEEGKKENVGDAKPELKIKYSRVDVILSGAKISRENIEYGKEESGYINFYRSNLLKGVTHVRHFKNFTIKNIYPGIDWVWHSDSSSGLKYDFVIHSGANASAIKMIYKWAKISIDENGKTVLIKTPLGEITEGEIQSFQNENKITSNYFLTLENEIAFNISDYNHEKDLVIDPPLALAWGTYYGGTGIEGITNASTDPFDNLIVSGYTSSADFPVMDQGSGAFYMGTFTGQSDAFISKFNSANQLLWSTYFGATDLVGARAHAVDSNGNIFISGNDYGPTIPLQNPGGGAYFQSSSGGGGLDAFIARFDVNGILNWSTFYGGDGEDWIFSLTTDNLGNLFAGGYTNSSNFPVQNAGGGSFYQAGLYALAQYDNFIIKFSNNGVRQWSTYVGGSYDDKGISLSTDVPGNLLATGITTSPDYPIQNLSGAYNQSVFNGGSSSSFAMKFDINENLIWSTFLGGSGYDRGISCAADPSGNFYLTGETDSPNFPTNDPGGGAYFQNSLGGTTDIYISKFNSSCSLQWSTYYGGTSIDQLCYYGSVSYANPLFIDSFGNVYLTFLSKSSDLFLLNPGNGAFFQGVLNGTNRDDVISVFDQNGVIHWATLFGSIGADMANSVTVNSQGDIYAVGEWNGINSNAILNSATGSYFVGAHISGDDSYIVKFEPLNPIINLPLEVNTISTPVSCSGNCDGYAFVIPTGGTAPYNFIWSFNGSTNDSIFNLCAGNYFVTVTDSLGATAVDSVIVNSPNVLATSVSNAVINCFGDSADVNITASGGTTPYTGTGIFTLGSGNYNYIISDAHGCADTVNFSLTEPPQLNITVIAGTISCFGGTTTVHVTANGGTLPFSGTGDFIGGAGNHTYTVTDANGCAQSQTISITQPLAFSVSITESGNIICYGDSVHLVANASEQANFTWLPGNQTSVSINEIILQSENFILTGTNDSGCVDTAMISITMDLPTVSLGNDLTIPCNATLIVLDAGNGFASYVWQNGNTLQYDTIEQQGEYSVVVTDNFGCEAFDTVQVNFNNCTDMEVPTAFTPNNDGHNDLFHILNAQNFYLNYLRIYNRWGELIFETEDINEYWDGKYLDKNCDAGVYVFDISGKNRLGNSVSRKGNVTLLR
ncbi:MAG TPA: hypothetical protein DCQ93_07245 [Bacteroidetes bacterium]|nr:hypothetical protein [Bacteroidota bacterium]